MTDLTKTVPAKRGSALLIVLGMLAFMVVSAVAFSAYMRSARLPSSFLRRTVASRELVKAALAEAIDEIDRCIAENPHPNVGEKAPRQKDQTEGSVSQTRNKWLGRVLMATNYVNTLVSRDSTVPTLTMEGMAYVPPPIMDDVRYYSRRTQTAQWKSLPYDAGRYAYAAVDVSDYFDVNAVRANVPRSSAPGRRITLAHLFENVTHSSYDRDPAQWDEKFIEQNFLGGGSKVPLTSVADLNLALYDKKPTGWTSAFCEYVWGGGSSFSGLSEAGATTPELRWQAGADRMPFVTDSWMRPDPPLTDGTRLDLADEQNQPFPPADLKNKGQTPKSYYAIAENYVSRPLLKRLCNKDDGYASMGIPNVAVAALWDYLDEDRIPVSLSIPTTERVPMVCGITPAVPSASLKVKADDPVETYANETTTSRQATRVETYRLDADALAADLIGLKAVLAYPFRHQDGVSDTFEVDGRVALFLAEGEMGLRAGSAVNALQFAADRDLDKGSVQDGVIRIPLSSQKISFTKVSSEQDAVKEVSLTAKSPAAVAQYLNGDGFLLRVTYTWNQTKSEENPVWMPSEPTADNMTAALCGLPGLMKSGAVRANMNGNAAGALKEAPVLNLNMAVWVRVRLNNDVVDMVPASVRDDEMNNSPNWKDPESQVLLGDNFGAVHPLLRFNTGASVTYSIDGLKALATGSPVTVSPAGILVADPRHNHAPESWFVSAGEVTGAGWLANNGAKDAKCDGDIFMSVSDQYEMQSIYELANLPRFGNEGFRNFGNEERGHFVKPDSITLDNHSFVASGNEANRSMMWKTYDPFAKRHENGGNWRTEGDGDGFDLFDVVNHGSDFLMNPYAENTNSILAAFANAPHDWRCASRNNTELNAYDMDAKEFNQQHAWNSYSSGAKLDWKDVSSVAAEFMRQLRLFPNEDWEDVYREKIAWAAGGTDAGKYLLEDVALSGKSDEIHNTDRKFLYGFWHDSFAVKQQLFLVFVRSEPMLMGGGAAGAMPPQLGARAVALVWRDPTVTGDANKPHKTRVLFYRQMD